MYTKSKGEKDDEEKDKSFLQLEPFDPNLADVDKIMKRYADKDARVQLDLKNLAVEGDKSGGLVRISTESQRHSSSDDETKIKNLLE